MKRSFARGLHAFTSAASLIGCEAAAPSPDRAPSQQRSQLEEGPPPDETADRQPNADEQPPDSRSVVAPELSDVSFPKVVTAGTGLVVTWRVRDPAGLSDDGAGRPATWVRIGGTSGWVSWCDFTLMGTLVEGDLFDGRYEAVCAVPTSAVEGGYGLWFGASSSSGASFLPEAAETFEVVGGSTDADVPRVTELAVTPPSAAPGETVTLTWRATDATGVAYVVPWAMGPNGRFVDDAGALWLSWGEATLIEGDERDGRWEVSLELSGSAVSGRYDLWLSRGDTLGNRDISRSDPSTGATAFNASGSGDTGGDDAVSPAR